MYAPAFDYHRPSSVAEAQRLLAANPGAKLLAGGHSLLPMLKLRLAAPTALIDIGRIDALHGITETHGGLRIGAMTTHAGVASSTALKKACPVVADAASHIGDMAVRNRGTIGGSVAHADPSADMPTVLTAIGATMEIAGANGATRSVAAADFFQGMMATAIGDGEILTAVWVPVAGAGTGAAYAKFSHPASRYAVVGAAASITLRGGTCERAIIVVGGVTATPTRLGAVEKALAGTPVDDAAIARAAAAAAGDLGADLMGDIYASADYRRHVTGTYVARAITAAAAQGAVSGAASFTSIDDVQARLATAGYVAGRGLATSIFLAVTLRRPLFLEGEAGVGKTAVAQALAAVLDVELIRLQCYEGLDVSHAVYEWDYARQLLELRILEAARSVDRDGARRELFSERYLLKRPLLRALEGAPGRAPVLLIDEIDRADEEFEGYLLELLSEYRITVPELGTIAAVEPPVVVLTSNRTREVHDALKRRCLYQWIEYPAYDKELAIVERRVPGAGAELSRQVTAVVQELRTAELYKAPGVSETLDWVAALVALDRTALDPATIDDTLGVVLKAREDIEAMKGERLQGLLARAMLQGVRRSG